MSFDYVLYPWGILLVPIQSCLLSDITMSSFSHIKCICGFMKPYILFCKAVHVDLKLEGSGIVSASAMPKPSSLA